MYQISFSTFERSASSFDPGGLGPLGMFYAVVFKLLGMLLTAVVALVLWPIPSGEA